MDGEVDDHAARAIRGGQRRRRWFLRLQCHRLFQRAFAQRLRHEGFVDGRVEASDRGPARRYFSLTPLGQKRLAEMREHWTGLTRGIEQLDGTPKKGGKKP